MVGTPCTTALATVFENIAKEMGIENNGRRSLNQSSPELSSLFEIFGKVEKMSLPGIEPGPPALNAGALTTRPQRRVSGQGEPDPIDRQINRSSVRPKSCECDLLGLFCVHVGPIHFLSLKYNK